jgi:peptidyl-prolyl cis-trans isomerase D
MLNLIREKATGWIAGVIVGLLIISFSLWGVSSYFGQGGDVVVAKVNGTDIKMRSYQRAFYNLRQQMQKVFKTTLTQTEDDFIKNEALKRLVEAELLNQVVADLGLQLSDNDVRESIKSLELFQGENGFDKNFYEQGISSLGMTPASFEHKMRLDILSEQLQSALAESVFVTSEEASRIASQRGQKRDIAYTILNTDSHKDSINVTEEDIKQYYEDHTQQYLEPEQVKIAYIDHNIKNLSEKVSVSEDDLRAHYENNREDYDVEEQRQIKQLYVKLDKDAPDELTEAARTKMQSLRELALSGKTFVDIVDDHADDPGPLFEYSEHGFISRGILPVEVGEFLFAGKEGDLSEPIRSEKGFHLIKVGEIKGGPKNTFENSRADVEEDYRYKQAENEFFEQADQLTTLTYEHPDTLELAAEAIGATIHESEFFSRNSDKGGLTSEPMIISASFSEDVMIGNNNSEAIELGDNRVVVLRMIEHKPEKKKPLESVRDNIIDTIKLKKASEKTSEVAQEVIRQIQAGADPEQVATDNNFEWTYAEGVTRDDVNVTRSVLRVAFSLGNPEPDHSLIGGTSLGTGGYAIVRVSSAENPTVEDIDEENVKMTVQELIRREVGGEWSGFINDVRENADIRLFTDNI